MRDPVIRVDKVVEKHLEKEEQRIREARRKGKPFWTAYHPAKAANFLMAILLDRGFYTLEEKREIYKSLIPTIKTMSDKDKDRIREACAELKEESR